MTPFATRRWTMLACGMFVFANAAADDVRPVQVQIREREPRVFLVQWQVPQVMQPQAMPMPLMPEGCEPEGARTVEEQPGAWLNRQIFRCRHELAGQSIGIRYPFGNPSLSTVLRIELLTGDRYATLLAPTDDAWEIPAAPSIDAPLRAVSDAVLGGVRHVFDHPIHIVFVLAVTAFGSIRLVTYFGVGQIVAVILAAFGVELATAFSEAALALATLLLANQVFRSGEPHAHVGSMVGAAGMIHGLGLASVTDGSATLVLAILGMDVTFLTLGVVLAKIVSANRRFQRTAAYASGIASVALGLGLMFFDAPDTQASRSTAPFIPSALRAPSGAQASRRVSPAAVDAPMQSFLAIEAFEVRHEVLVRLGDVADAIGLGILDTIAVTDQVDIKQRVAELVHGVHAIDIDGVTAPNTIERVDFMTVDAQGVLPRTAPVPEPVDRAYVGVTAEYLTPSTAREVVLRWIAFDVAQSVPATVTDPEVSQGTVLTAGTPELSWTNVLAEDPTPSVTAIAVEPTQFPLPLLSIPLILAAAWLTWAGWQGRRSEESLLAARVVLGVGLVVGPLGAVPVSLPFNPAPSEGQARRVLAGILPNVYRAFEFRDETAAYDRLAVSITGETLTDIYLEHRRALEMEERGGARARVEAVEVLEVPSVTAGSDGGFDAQASWSVSGMVTHFGHRHFRQNRYEARVVVVPVEGTWKIRSIEVLDEQRVR